MSFTAVWTMEGADGLCGGGGGGQKSSMRSGEGEKDSAFSLGQVEIEPSERSCSVDGLISNAQERDFNWRR